MVKYAPLMSTCHKFYFITYNWPVIRSLDQLAGLHFNNESSGAREQTQGQPTPPHAALNIGVVEMQCKMLLSLTAQHVDK